jgi:hypothetical protein
VVGERVQLADGSWCSESISQRKLAEKYGIPQSTIVARATREKWSNLRKAYLMKVTEEGIGEDLNLYEDNQNVSEIQALNAVEKLGKVLGTYIDSRYSAILEANERIDGRVELTEDVEAELSRVNTNTGIPVFINELNNAVKVTRDIYDLSRKIYENSPHHVSIEAVTSTENLKFRNDKEREIKLEQLKKRLALSEEQAKSMKTAEESTTVERKSPYRSNPVVDVKEYTSL